MTVRVLVPPLPPLEGASEETLKTLCRGMYEILKQYETIIQDYDAKLTTIRALLERQNEMLRIATGGT